MCRRLDITYLFSRKVVTSKTPNFCFMQEIYVDDVKWGRAHFPSQECFKVSQPFLKIC